MSLIKWGALGELIGGVAIIVSLLYVGTQIKHNTKAERASASQAFIDIHAQIVLHISGDKDFRDIYWRGLGGLSALQGSETAAFGAWAIQTFRAWESFYFQWKEGLFQDQLWAGWQNQFADLFGYPGIQEYWAIRRHQFSEEFCELVDKLIASEASEPLYPVAQEVSN